MQACNAGTIEGRVLLDGDSAKPLGRIEAVLDMFNEQYNMYTDLVKVMQIEDDGKFTFSDLKDGKYQVRFASNRFRSGGDLAAYFAPPIRDVVINDQNKSYARDVAVQVGVTIKGKVVDEANHPIEGVVVAPHVDATNGNLSVRTDGSGDFVLTGIRPDADCEILYGIFAKCDYGRTQIINKDRMKAGGEVVIPDVVFEKKTGKPDLIGIVLDGDGIPLAKMKSLTLKCVDPTIGGAIIAIKGKFAIEVPTGKYTSMPESESGIRGAGRSGCDQRAGNKGGDSPAVNHANENVEGMQIKLKVYSIGLVSLQALLLWSSGRRPLDYALTSLLTISGICLFLRIGPARTIFLAAAVAEMVILVLFIFFFVLSLLLTLLGGSSDTFVELLIRLAVSIGVIVYLVFGMILQCSKIERGPG
jgi:hypothetical protein